MPTLLFCLCIFLGVSQCVVRCYLLLLDALGVKNKVLKNCVKMIQFLSCNRGYHTFDYSLQGSHYLYPGTIGESLFTIFASLA